MSDESEVIQAFDALFDAALDDRDADAMLALFAQDDDITFWGSDEPERGVGPEGVRALADAIVSSRSTLRFRWDERRVHVEAKVAWVNATGSFEATSEDGVARTAAYRLTAVFVRRGEHWLWHTFSGAEPN